jgi:hypothetical protein
MLFGVTACVPLQPARSQHTSYARKVKANPLQALTGPEGSRGLRLPGFKTIGT